MDQKLGYDVLKIVLASIVPVTLGAICYNPVKRKFAARRAAKENRAADEARRAKLEERRDALLAKMMDMLTEIGGDVRCIYESQPAKFDALEVALRALHGEKVNGNVDKALARIEKARDEVNRHTAEKIGCVDIGEGVD